MKSMCVYVALLLGLLVGCSRQSAKQLTSLEDTSKERFQHLPADVRELLEFLDDADEFELASLDPEYDHRTPGAKFWTDGWQVVGRTQIDDHQTRTKLINALLRGIEEGGKPVKCFEPRHRIRAVRGGKSVVITICFACGNVYFSPQEGYFSISASPADIFNQTLEKASIPLKPQGDH
jgi:hypothetical protein